jgi:hypothetical protein
LFNLATTYGQRPSTILDLETEIGAWVIDETCLLVGRLIEKAMDENKDPFEEKFSNRKSGYSSAKISSVKRMKIPDNGVW